MSLLHGTEVFRKRRLRTCKRVGGSEPVQQGASENIRLPFKRPHRRRLADEQIDDGANGVELVLLPRIKMKLHFKFSFPK